MIAAAVPEKVIVESPLPSPAPKLRPAVLARVSVPLPTASVTVSVVASTSVTDNALPLAELKMRAMSSSMVWAPGTS